METKQFNQWEFGKYFKMKSPIRDTNNILEASPEYIKDINEKNQAIFEALKKKHNTDNPREALKLEMKEIAKLWQPSKEALEYIELLNKTYSGKTIKFYYSDPMLYHCGIDDPDCDHIPVYEKMCQSIELIDSENGTIPMIITKDKNYSMKEIVEIKVINE